MTEHLRWGILATGGIAQSFVKDLQLIGAPVVAVGSRTPRTNVDSPVAVDVITSEDIGRSGRTETGRVLGQLEPSYLSVPQTIADGSDHHLVWVDLLD